MNSLKPEQREQENPSDIKYSRFYSAEWPEADIKVRQSAERCELLVDGIVQDSQEGKFSLFFPENFSLRGQSRTGDQIEVRAVTKFMFYSQFEFYVNGELIHAAGIESS